MSFSLDIDAWLTANNNGFGNGRLYVNWPELIAQKASRLTIGKGLVFNSDKIEIQEKLTTWYEQNRITEKLRLAEFINSLWGKSVIYLSPSKDKKNIQLCVVRNNYQARVSKVNEIEQVAEIWTQDYQGDMPLFTKVSITPDKIDVDFYTSEKPQTQIANTIAPVQEELVSQKHHTWPNKFGIMPVVECQNLPFNNIWNQTYYNIRPDWVSVAWLIERYQITHRITVVETKANRTRYFGQLTPEQIKQINNGVKDMAGMNDLMGDAYVNSGYSTQYANGTQTDGINVVAGDPKLTEYDLTLDTMGKMIFNGSGYSEFNNGADTTYQNKTSALFSPKLDVETTKTKQALRKPKYYQLFDFVLKYFGLEPFDEHGNRQYTFDFIGSGITDETTEIERTKNLLELGLITQTEARAKLLNEPMNIAEEHIKRVRDDIQAQNEQAMEDNGDLDDGNEEEPDFKVDNDQLGVKK